MVNLRALAETDLGVTLEGEWSMLVKLTGPSGVEQPDIPAQVVYETIEETETGVETIVRPSVVTVRISTLVTVPVSGETWGVEIPVSPVVGAATETFILSDRPLEGGESIGFLRLYLTKAEQV